MRYVVAYTDMTDIYDELLCNWNGFPQVMVMENLPYRRKVMRYVFEDGRTIIYLKKDSNMLETLVKEMISEKAVREPASEYMYHSCSDEIFAKLTFICVMICKMLGIECPQLEIRKNKESYGTSISEKNHIILRDFTELDDYIYIMIRTMAHELRHLWQYKNKPEFFRIPQSELTVEEYLFSESEIDAEAFSNKLLTELTGIDSIEETPEYALGNKIVVKKVREAEKKIELDEESLEMLWDVLE